MKKHDVPLIGALVGTLFLLGASTAGAQSLRDQALARGVKLPNPFGISISLYTQSQNYMIDQLTLGVQSIDPAAAKNLKIENTTNAAHLQADYWVLPFLDVYGILGEVHGTTKVNLSQVNIGLPLQDLELKYQGLLYGAGIVLAYGGEHVFGTLDFNYNNTSLDVETSSVSAWLATPRIGYNFGKVAAYLGAMYQRPQERHKGTFDIPGFGPVPYDVTLGAKDAWSYIAGLNAPFGPHWVLTLEGGFGPRTAALVHLDYRF
jgi:hypothetical protein